MNTGIKRIIVIVLLTFTAGLWGGRCFAQSWRAVQDANGWTWARVSFVNQSTNASHWAVWNCRTAVASSAAAATVDPVLNWDGVVNAGETKTVWVYVMGPVSDSAHIDSADGGISAYLGAQQAVLSGDSEWVITIGADSAVSGALVTGASYGAPAGNVK